MSFHLGEDIASAHILGLSEAASPDGAVDTLPQDGRRVAMLEEGPNTPLSDEEGASEEEGEEEIMGLDREYVRQHPAIVHTQSTIAMCGSAPASDVGSELSSERPLSPSDFTLDADSDSSRLQQIVQPASAAPCDVTAHSPKSVPASEHSSPSPQPLMRTDSAEAEMAPDGTLPQAETMEVVDEMTSSVVSEPLEQLDPGSDT